MFFSGMLSIGVVTHIAVTFSIISTLLIILYFTWSRVALPAYDFRSYIPLYLAIAIYTKQ